MGAKETKRTSSDSVTIVWTDSNINTCKHNIQIKHDLESGVHDLCVFEDVDSCVEHVTHLSSCDYVLLIVSGTLSKDLIPKIHSLSHILSIYIFCKDKNINREWSKNYGKVTDVIVDGQQLIEAVLKKKTFLNKAQDRLSIAIYDGFGKSTTRQNGDFVYSQLLLHCLLTTSSARNGKKEFVSFYRKKFKSDISKLEEIDRFDRDYLPNQAVWWYTKHSFIFQTLNAALRTKHIDTIFLMRFFICDLQDQLKQIPRTEINYVYRGQGLTTTEFEQLEKSVGKIISVNSFFSTTRQETIALEFMEGNSSPVKVIFHIRIHWPLSNNPPFADISSLSNYPEQEVLFLYGSLFLVEKLTETPENYWIINLVTSDEHDQNIELIIKQMKLEYTNGEDNTNIFSLGVLLIRMSQYDQAEQHFSHLLRTLPANDENIGQCYYSLGMISNEKGNHNKSIDWYEKWLKWNKTKGEKNLDDIYICIAGAYQQKGDWKRAIDTYQKALQTLQHEDEQDTKIGLCFNNIGNIYQTLGNYNSALDCHKKALVIYENSTHLDYCRLALAHNNLGIDYQELGQYEIALNHLKKSLEIKNDALPSTHLDIAKTLAIIGHVYCEQKNFTEAYSHFQQARDIFELSFSSEHPCLIKIWQEIENVSSHLGH